MIHHDLHPLCSPVCYNVKLWLILDICELRGVVEQFISLVTLRVTLHFLKSIVLSFKLNKYRGKMHIKLPEYTFNTMKIKGFTYFILYSC